MAPFKTRYLRNVALLSHSGAGKTSLTEAILFATGGVTRLGKVEDGTTISDYEPEEVKRQNSIQTAVIPCIWQDHKVNFIDTPGYPDFIGQAISGLRAADAAILVVAAQSGVEVGTEDAWGLCEEQGLTPRIIFINKMDRETADFQGALGSIQAAFGKKCTALQVPMGAQQQFKGVVGLLQPPAEVPAEMADEVDRLRDRLIEAIAESDDGLATQYLEGKEISQQTLAEALRRSVLKGDIVPVLTGSAHMSLGVTELMDAILELLPSPADIQEIDATLAGASDSTKLTADFREPLAALVFMTTADPFVGKLSYFRIFSGTMNSDSHVWNSAKSQDERIGQLFVPKGKAQESTDSLIAGDIGAVAKLSTTVTGDTLVRRDNLFILETIHFPEPVFASAIYPNGKADLDKMASSLTRLAEEDPTLHLSREFSTGETLLFGMGETHIEVALEKTKRKFGIELVSSLPKIAYKETISTGIKTEYRHKKQTGGHGQYGHVMIELEPLPRGSGFEFGAKVVGGNVPKEYIPSVEKGVVKSLDDGVLAGYPIVDLKAILYDGSSHPVDSSGMSFEIAGSYALRKGVSEAQPTLLEPIMRLTAIVPDRYTGEVIGDLNSKRARILGMTPLGGMTAIDAEAPQAEVRRYATELRSLTQGRGRFTMEFTRYDDVPQAISQRVIEESKKVTTGT